MRFYGLDKHYLGYYKFNLGDLKGRNIKILCLHVKFAIFFGFNLVPLPPPLALFISLPPQKKTT